MLAYNGISRFSTCSTPRVGYVKLNGDMVWQGSWCGSVPNLRGVTTLLIDPFSCSVQQSRRYDTYWSSVTSHRLRDYILQLNHGSVIVGVTADEPMSGLYDALSALRQIGVDVDDVQYGGSFAFIAQKGYRAKTVLSKAVTEAESNRAPASIYAVITGIHKVISDRSHNELHCLIRPTLSGNYLHFGVSVSDCSRDYS